MAMHFECLANGANASVHHVAWRNDIRAGIGLIYRLIDKHGNRFVVQYITGIID